MKRLKRLLHRRLKNSGFTLVEMIVSCGLLGILVLGVTAFIGPVLRTVGENEENVRAKLLTQTIDDFVTRSTRDSYYIAIFTNKDRADAYDGGTVAEDENLKKMKAFVDKNNDVYEFKCMSYTWAEDPQSNEYKYMLMTEKFKSASTAIENKPVPVFEYCFYDGLFPQITIEPVMVNKLTSDSSEESAESGEEKTKVAAAIKSTYTVYTDQKMAVPDFIGIGYTEFCAVRVDSDENKTSNYKFYPINEIDSGAEHPTTFIYYVVRKPNRFDVKPSSSTT